MTVYIFGPNNEPYGIIPNKTDFITHKFIEGKIEALNSIDLILA